MRLLIVLLFALGQFKRVTAQTNAEEVKLPKPKGNLNCVYKKKYSATQRNKFYPFNIADTIKLASFRYHKHILS